MSGVPATTTAPSLTVLLRGGAERAAEERGFHAVALDARIPRFDGGIATRLDTIPFGVVLDARRLALLRRGGGPLAEAVRDLGRHIAGQPGQIAYALWDARVHGLFLPPMYGAIRDDTLAVPPRRLGLDRGPWPSPLTASMRPLTRALAAASPWRRRTAWCSPEGIDPPKSNWAQRVDTPPFYGVPDAAGDHLHLPRRRRHGAGARAGGGRRHLRERVRGWGDHVGQHPVAAAISPGSG